MIQSAFEVHSISQSHCHSKSVCKLRSSFIKNQNQRVFAYKNKSVFAYKNQCVFAYKNQCIYVCKNYVFVSESQCNKFIILVSIAGPHTSWKGNTEKRNGKYLNKY